MHLFNCEKWCIKTELCATFFQNVAVHFIIFYQNLQFQTKKVSSMHAFHFSFALKYGFTTNIVCRWKSWPCNYTVIGHCTLPQAHSCPEKAEKTNAVLYVRCSIQTAFVKGYFLHHSSSFFNELVYFLCYICWACLGVNVAFLLLI